MKDIETLLSELSDAIYLNTTDRQKENLCSDAYHRIVKMKKALTQIEKGCSFPEDEIQKAIVKVAREALA